MKWRIFIGLFVLFCGLAFWAGEADEKLFGNFLLFSIIPAVFFTLFSAPTNLWGKVILGCVFVSSYSYSFYLGTKSYMRAYNECVTQGEVIREQLTTFYQQNLQYPEHLSQINGFNACKRVMHPTILMYQTTALGYQISFDDGHLLHRATESQPFEAHK
ncbi:MAG: hypothetical protein CTY12_08410 [Methylotenera sp.]|nr:MAG: hypothetical protein CTY12_08410 [Methylotenera sp.]